MALRLSPSEMAALVPESAGWSGGVYHWITMMGTFEGIIGYAELLWPDFVEHDGCVLSGRINPDHYRSWLEKFNGNRREVERMCNHVDLDHLIENPDEVASDAQLRYLGRLICVMWEAKLAREFPDRRFSVELHDEPHMQPVVTFSQIQTA